jgi:hypothetical protein
MQTCTCRKVCSKNANKAKFFFFLGGLIGGKSGIKSVEGTHVQGSVGIERHVRFPA